MSKLVRIFGLLVALSLVLTACAQQPTPTPQVPLPAVSAKP